MSSMYSNQIAEVKKLILLRGKPLFVHGTNSAHRMDICRKAIHDSGFCLFERTCSGNHLDAEKFLQEWRNIRNIPIADSVLLITNLSCIWDHPLDLSQTITRIILHFMRNSKRRMILTGFTNSHTEITNKAANSLHIDY